MKKYFLPIVLILLLACKARQKHSELGFGQELKKTFIEASDECLKEMLTYEDDYLSNLKGLDGYSWNQKNTTATLKISEEKILEVQIKGCDPIVRSCKFIVSNDFTLEENENQITEDFLWISKLVLNKKEFEKFNRNFKIKDLSNKDSDNKGSFLILSEEEKIESFIAFYEDIEDIKTYSIFYFFK